MPISQWTESVVKEVLAFPEQADGLDLLIDYIENNLYAEHFSEVEGVLEAINGSGIVYMLAALTITYPERERLQTHRQALANSIRLMAPDRADKLLRNRL